MSDQEGTADLGTNQQEATEAEGNNQDGKAPGWIAGLPEDVRGQAAETGFQKVGDLWSAYSTAQEKLSKSVIKPGEDASEEEWSEYRKAMGVPEEPDAYSGGDALGDRAQELREIAHQAGLTQEQYNAMVNAQVEKRTQMMQERQEAEKKLRQQLGQGFDTKLAKARRIVTHFGDESFDQFLAENDLNTDPRMIQTMMRIADAFGEHSLPEGGKPESDPRVDRQKFLKKLYPSLS